MSPLFNFDPNKRVDSGCAITIIVVFVVFLLILLLGGGLSNSSSSKKTDGIFESAMEKLDKNIPLNKREIQRVDDIINYKDNQRAKEIEKRNGER